MTQYNGPYDELNRLRVNAEQVSPITADGKSGVTPLSGGGTNVANASAVGSLVPSAGKTAYITGFQITGSGANAGLPVTVTLTGTFSGTKRYTYTFVAGVLLGNTPLIVAFSPAFPASAIDTTITVTCPASGAGGTNNVVDVFGFER